MAGEECHDCDLFLEPPPTAHARLVCDRCGRDAYRGPTAEGVHIEAGETFVIPQGAISLSINPCQSTGRFSKEGVNWFMGMLLFDPEPTDADELRAAIAKLSEDADTFLTESSLLCDFDLESEDPDQAEAWVAFLRERQHTAEWAALRVCVIAKGWLDEAWVGDRSVLLWKLATARALFIFRSNLQDVVWRGYTTMGVEQLRSALEVWNARTGDEDEEHWQRLLDTNPFLINLMTTGPVIVEQQKAYVGGKGFHNQGGNVVDFLLKNSVGGNAGLLEIKTPKTRLLAKSSYRDGVYAVSSDLAGAIAQIAAYKDTLLKEFHALSRRGNLSALNPLGIVLAGHQGDELQDVARRRSFELVRSSLSGISVITYDELFERARRLLQALEGAHEAE